MDLAQVGLEFETAGLKQGETAALGTFDRVEKGALKTQAAVGATGKVFDDVAQQAVKAAQAGTQSASVSDRAAAFYEKEAAAIRQKYGAHLTEIEVYRKIMAVRQDAIAIADRERAQTEAWVQAEKKREEALKAAAGAGDGAAAGMDKAGQAGSRAAAGVGRIGSAIASMGVSAVGAKAGLGSLIYGLGLLGPGGALTTAALSGAAALGLAYLQLTATERATKKQIDETIKSLEKQRSELAQTRFAISILGEALDNSTKKMADMQQGTLTLGAAWDIAKRLIVGSAGSIAEAVAQRFGALANEQKKLQGSLTEQQAKATSQFVAQLAGFASAYGGLVSARLADSRQVQVARDLYIQLGQQIAGNTLRGNDLIAAIQARATLQGALNRSTYEANQLEGIATARTKERANAEAQLQAFRAGGLTAQQRLSEQQATEAKAIQEAEAAWNVYRQRLGETAMAHLTVEQAALKGNTTAQLYLATARENAEAIAAANRALKLATELYTDGTTPLQRYIAVQKELRAVIADEPIAFQRLTDRMKAVNAEARDKGVPYTKDAAKLGFIPDPATVSKALEQIDRIKAHAVSRAQEMNGLFNDAFKDFFGRGLKDWEAFFFAVQQLAGNVAQMIAKDIAFKMKEGLSVSGLERFGGKALGGAAAGLGVGLASGNPLIGALGGAASGFAVAGPIGAIAGGVSGLVSGLIGSAAKAREAAEQMRKATQAFQLSMDDFVAIAQPRGAFGDAMVGLKKQMLALQEAAAAIPAAQGRTYDPKLHGGRSLEQELALSAAELQKELDALNKRIAEGGHGRGARDFVQRLLEIRQATDAAAAAIAAQIALEKQRLGEDLTVRDARAKGLTEEADALALANAQAREYADLLRSMGTAIDQVLLDQLKYVQGLEAEARAREKAAAIRDRDIATGFGLSEREAALKGDTLGGLAAARARQEADANRLRDTGGISAENYHRLIAVIFGEFTKAVQQIADEAEAATLALFNYNRAAREDLQVRLLVAQGQDAAGEALRQRLSDEREYAQALREGADATTLAMLAQVQAAEASRRAADEAKRLAQAMEDQARAFEDLTVRMLRATGQGGAGDAGAQLFAQQEERRRAIEAGRSKAFLDELERVQAQERAFADAARRTAQQEAFDQAFPTTTSQAVAAQATKVDLAVGLSETTGGRIAGLLASNNAYLSALPRIEAMLAAALSGKEFAVVLDETMAQNSSSAAGAAGVLPSNR